MPSRIGTQSPNFRNISALSLDTLWAMRIIEPYAEAEKDPLCPLKKTLDSGVGYACVRRNDEGVGRGGLTAE